VASAGHTTEKWAPSRRLTTGRSQRLSRTFLHVSCFIAAAHCLRDNFVQRLKCNDYSGGILDWCELHELIRILDLGPVRRCVQARFDKGKERCPDLQHIHSGEPSRFGSGLNTNGSKIWFTCHHLIDHGLV
jgi:hypothetical protein